jgi:hypothetical protein
MAILTVEPKDPSDIDWFFFIWCSRDGTNANTTTNTGRLAGATISSYTLTADAGLTVVSDNKSAVTVQGVSYGASTVVSAKVSGGINGNDYNLLCEVVTSDGRTLQQTMKIPVKDT